MIVYMRMAMVSLYAEGGREGGREGAHSLRLRNDTMLTVAWTSLGCIFGDELME